MPLVQSAAATYFDLGCAPPDVPNALCSTHWLPLAAGSWPAAPASLFLPRHALEAAVLAVARSASRMGVAALGDVDAVCGVEWWLQEQWPDDLPKELHTDKAVGPATDEDATLTSRHPLVSSVLYLSASGGPTAVFKDSTVALGFPAPGSLLLFQGDLAHCVLHAPPAPLGLEPTDAHPRRTLLVNFWDRRPPGATDALLPELLPSAAQAGDATDPSPAGPSGPLHLVEAEELLSPHADSWRKQRLPESIIDHAVQKTKSSGSGARAQHAERLPLIVVEYKSSADGRQDKVNTLVQQLEAVSLD